MTIIANALDDIKADVIGGATLENAISFAAQEYKLNAELLRRKFTESFGSVDSVKVFSEKTDKAKNVDALVKRNIEALCKKYGVTVDGCVIRTGRNGKKYSVICGLSRNRVVVVRMEDGAMQNGDYRFFH